MTSIILHTLRPNCQWKVCYALGFYVAADFLFSHFEELKSTFITSFPFRPTRYVLKSFRCLEVSNFVRNWNKVININYVSLNILLFQLEIPIFLNKLMCQRSLINSVSFVFCEFIRFANWNVGKTIILVWSSFQIPK